MEGTIGHLSQCLKQDCNDKKNIVLKFQDILKTDGQTDRAFIGVTCCDLRMEWNGINCLDSLRLCLQAEQQAPSLNPGPGQPPRTRDLTAH